MTYFMLFEKQNRNEKRSRFRQVERCENAPTQKVNFVNTNWSNCIDAPANEVWMAFFWAFFFGIAAVAEFIYACAVCAAMC